VVTIDTGRLPEEQYDIIETFRRRYGIQVEVLFPDASAVETMVRRHGVNLFRQAVDRRLLCCHVRKILPLNRALKGLGAWATGHDDDRTHPAGERVEHLGGSIDNPRIFGPGGDRRQRAVEIEEEARVRRSRADRVEHVSRCRAPSRSRRPAG